MTKEEIENKIATLTGGRAAEEVVFGEITTGASNDIGQATKHACPMITRYGMSEEFDMVALETVNNRYLGGDASPACSAQTRREIDQKVVESVKKQHEKAVRILNENRVKPYEPAKFPYVAYIKRKRRQSRFAKKGKRKTPDLTSGAFLAPQVGLEPTTLRLTAECSAIELLRNMVD